MYPEASRDDIKTLLHMARPKDFVPKAKPDQGVRRGGEGGEGEGGGPVMIICLSSVGSKGVGCRTLYRGRAIQTRVRKHAQS